MLMRWEKELDVFGPIEQAGRCLDIWLREEKRCLPDHQKQRVAALMARYFHHEDQVTDALMLSFLRHYSDRNNVDMEDPASVRMGIKAVLDQSYACAPATPGKKRLLTALMAGVMMAAILGTWAMDCKKITKAQQAELKAMVHQVAALDRDTTYAAIWAGVKTPLRVRSYQDITWWKYRQGRTLLEKKVAELTRK